MPPKTVVGEVLEDVGDAITGVSILKWGVAPGAVTAVLVMLFIVFVIETEFTGTGVINVCTGNGSEQVCKDEEYSNWKKFPISLIVSLLIGAAVGGSFYKLGLAIYNPKAAAGIAGIGMLSSAVRSA